MSDTTLSDRLTPLAAELADILAKKETLAEREAQLRAAIRDLTAGDPGSYGAGPLTVTVSQSRRLDLDAVAARYPATERPELYTLAPDTKAVRRHLPPAELDDLMTVVGEPRVGVK